MEQRDTRGQVSTARFKCMHHAGCNEGTHFEHKEKKEPWHEPGSTRWARQHVGNDKRQGQWDGFCVSHKGEAQEQSLTQGVSMSGAVRTGGLAEKGKGAGAGRVAGRKRKRQPEESNQAARISANLRVLAASHPRAWITEDLQVIPHAPHCRVQTHTDFEASEVLAMTTRIAMDFAEGKARPKADGTLTPGIGRWSGNTEDVIKEGSLPFLSLPRTKNRALGQSQHGVGACGSCGFGNSRVRGA